MTSLTFSAAPEALLWPDNAHNIGVKTETSSLFFPYYFSAMLATNATETSACFRLRHQVYCEELGFEALKPDNLETDAFDTRAMHACIQHNHKQQLVGTVRVITSCNNTELLPLEQHFAGLITEHSLAPQRFARQHICEISRLAVPAEVRRQHHRGNACSTTEQQCYRQVAVALYLIATQLCLQTNRYHSFVMIEPALARILRRIGIQFVQIGEAINYNGLRAPYYLDMRTTSVTLATEYQQLRARLAQQLNATPELQFIA
uniref:PEP-CTERM/exosortase system-associated acyltransferase n=1 Tax=Rheinheimera sp. TaxID=1869214 RepID=UPI004047A1DA